MSDSDRVHGCTAPAPGATAGRIPDGDGGWIWVSETTGKQGRRRLRISRHAQPARDDPVLGPKAALELEKRLRDFIYSPAGGRAEG